jgi:hypothetical protein
LQDPTKFTQIVIFWFKNMPSGNPAGSNESYFRELLAKSMIPTIGTEYFRLERQLSLTPEGQSLPNLGSTVFVA